MFSDLQDLIDKGYITKRKHPTLDLWIYNYSAACQFENFWTPTTMACRGLVLDKNDQVVATGPKKFLNIEQHTGPLPNGDFQVTEKADGSMLLLFWYENDWHCATRGSFESYQAVFAAEIIRNKYMDMTLSLPRNWSYIFEVVYPGNRIVVDYGDMEDLIFITALDPQTGRDLYPDSPEVMAKKLGILTPCVKTYDGITDVTKIRELGQKNQEGFVIRWIESDYRLKVKLEDYVRLHKLLTGVTPFRIWDMMQSGQDFHVWLEGVPDEFYRFVTDIKKDLDINYRIIEDQCKKDFKVLETRKDTALYFQTCKHPSVLFKMLDKIDYSQVIWKMLRPRGDSPPFRCDS